MRLTDSEKRRRRAVYLRGVQRPLECACLLWVLALMVLMASGMWLRNETYIDDDSFEGMALPCLLFFPLMLPGAIHPWVGVAFLFALYPWSIWKIATRFQHYRLMQVPILLLLTPVATLLMIKTGMPVRVSFLLNRTGFKERLLLGSESEFEWKDIRSVERVGSYRVHAVVADERGGTYFLLPETYLGWYPQDDYYFRGFVHEPNREGSPFSDHLYELTTLGGGWSFFRARSAPRWEAR